ncbi:TonB-dependent receptor [Sphingobium xenophagum]|uniref:TonB-dependent receptor n=1 Tax=Sphingobium xenophagum TaxID=121428 RepID=UPI00036FA6CF|nr:TonB-dependent receptor [Sphingobium xenophagum]
MIKAPLYVSPALRGVTLRAVLLGSTLIACGLSASAARAQDQPAPQLSEPQTPPDAENPQPSSVLGDIIVTATRRNESSQRIGLSITAFSGDQLAQLGVTNATDITKLTPAVSLYQVHPSVTAINIRGVSQNYFADHLEAPIAVYQDDAYIGSTGAIGVRSYDMERVEVLRGPQGTLFGRNATGGLIQYVSKPPTDKFEAYAQVTAGGYEYGNGYAQTEGAVSGPLSDTVRARLSVATNNDQGPWHNGIGANPGNTNEYAARLQIEAELGPSTTVRFIGSADINRDSRGAAFTTQAAAPGPRGLGVPLAPGEFGTYANLAALPLIQTITSPCPGCDLTGYRQGSNPYRLNLSNPGMFRRSIYGATLKVTHGFEGAELVSVTNYQNVAKRLTLDSDGSPSTLFDYGTQQRYNQFSQELRLSGSSDTFKWVTGAYYLRMRGNYRVDGNFDLGPYIGLTCTAPACVGGSPVQDAFRADYRLTDDTWSVFAQADYYLTPDLYLTAGARYTDDHKKFDYGWADQLGFQAVLTGGAPTVSYGPATDPSADRHFRNVSAKAQLNWTPAPGVLLYAGYTRGHKGGNWSSPIFPPIVVASLPHKQEVLSSYEGGAKLRLFNNRATLNGSIFYYDYKDYQAFAITNLVQQIFNVDAIAYGGEVEFRVNPAEGLDVSLTGAFMHSRVKNVPLPDGTFADRRLPDAPTASIGGLVRYSFDALGGRVGGQVNANYVGSHFLTALNERTNFQKDYATVDLRLDYASPDDKWTIAAFVRNVTNNAHEIFGLDVSSLGYAASVYAPPRTYGVTLGWKY